MPRSFSLVPLDRVDTANLLALVFDRPIKVILGLEVFLDDIEIRVCLVDPERRGEVFSLRVSTEAGKLPESQ